MNQIERRRRLGMDIPPPSPILARPNAMAWFPGGALGFDGGSEIVRRMPRGLLSS